MDLVQLKNGTTEIIGSHRDLVDIVRDGCGDEVAQRVEALDPADLEGVYDGYDKLFDLYYDYVKPLSVSAEGASKEQVEYIFKTLEEIVDKMGGCL